MQGYEDGYDEVTTVKEISIQSNTSQEWYNGKYINSDNAASERLLKAGIDGKTIENLYITYNNFKIIQSPILFVGFND